VRFDAGKYYRFGLAMGLANVARNGLQLGWKKSLGKILQPVNSYGRFPEYHYMETRIRPLLPARGGAPRVRILDVSSPKCFGLYLAYHFDAEVHLTDIDGPSVAEAEVLWTAMKRRAKGSAVFSIQDARSLDYRDGEFDIVFSMSVVEHIEGAAGDAAAIHEMVRVLKPRGTLLVTVPIGQHYVEQQAIGFAGAARSTGDRSSYFFQRIYTPETAQEHLLNCTSAVRLLEAETVHRSDGMLARLYRRLGLNTRGFLGFLNPVLSSLFNRTTKGVAAPPSRYGTLHSVGDLYGDLMLAWEKCGSGLPDNSVDHGEKVVAGRISDR
jgi:SAM-dependent methyltransferase